MYIKNGKIYYAFFYINIKDNVLAKIINDI